MTPRDNSRSRRPAEHREPRAENPALDRGVFCLDTHPHAATSLPLFASAGVRQPWCPLFQERERLAARVAFSDRSPLASQIRISNRNIPRLEAHLTPSKSARGSILIATKRDMHLSSLSSLPFFLREMAENLHRAVVSRPWMIYLLTLLQAFRAQSTSENAAQVTARHENRRLQRTAAQRHPCRRWRDGFLALRAGGAAALCR